MKTNILCPLEAKLARLCLLTGEITLADYYILSGCSAPIAQGMANFRAAKAHIKKVFEAVGLSDLSPDQDGPLVYRLRALAPGLVIDIVEGAESAEDAIALIHAEGATDKARQLVHRATELDPHGSAVEQAQHSLVLGDPRSSVTELRPVAHRTALRREEVRGYLSSIARMIDREEWQDYRNGLLGRQREFLSEFADLLFLQLCTTLRFYSEMAGDREDAQFLHVMNLAALARQEPGHYQNLFELALNNCPGVDRVVGQLGSYCRDVIKGRTPVRLSPDEVRDVVNGVVTTYLLADFKWERPYSRRAFIGYAWKACRARCLIECVAEGFSLTPDLVALVFRKWNFERKCQESHKGVADEAAIRAKLGLAGPAGDKRYQKVLDVEAELKALRDTLHDIDAARPDPLGGNLMGTDNETTASKLTQLRDRQLLDLRTSTNSHVVRLAHEWGRLKRTLRVDGEVLSDETMRTKLGASPEQFRQMLDFLAKATTIINHPSLALEDLL